ncbi:MAG: 50S ribosomal protein L23 [bacterium]
MSILDRFRRKQTKQRLQHLGKPVEQHDASPPAAAEQKVKKAPKEKELKKSDERSGSEKREKVLVPSEIAARTFVRPIITEKSVQKDSTYVFEVHPSVNKPGIQRAMVELYGVHPVHVRIQNRRGKQVRYGRHTGRTKNWKKAIVVLKQGETITITEGV